MAEKQTRILHVLGTLNPGGIETWLLHVLKRIDRNRFQFDFCLLGREAGLYEREFEELGAKIVRCPAGVNPWKFRRRFRRILEEGCYDVVHSHVTLFSGALLRWAKEERVPVRIAHSHTSRDDKPGTPTRMVYRTLMKSWIRKYATLELSASQPSATYLFGENWGQNPHVQVIHCGIDLRDFREAVSRNDVRQELDIPLNAPVIGHVGNFVPAKNHEFILQTAAEVLTRRHDVHFLLIGKGPLRFDIEKRVSVGRFASNIHIAGCRRDIPRLMLGAMDAFILPSLWEGLPMSLLEAQAAGLPCIISETIGHEGIVSGNVVSLGLAQGAEEWAKRILEVLAGGRNQEHSALDAIEQTDFCVDRSAWILSRNYASTT